MPFWRFVGLKETLDFFGYKLLCSISFLLRRFPDGLAAGLEPFLERALFICTAGRHVAYADMKAALGPGFSEKTAVESPSQAIRAFWPNVR